MKGANTSRLLIVLAAVALFGWMMRMKPSVPARDAGPAAPEAARKEATELDFAKTPGLPAHLSDLKGKVVILDFWATWCGPCRMSIPDIVQLYQKYHAQGLETIGISVDQPETQSKIPASVAELKINYPIALATATSGADAYNTGSIPVLYLIDKKGRIALQMEGYGGPSDLEDKVQELLKE